MFDIVIPTTALIVLLVGMAAIAVGDLIREEVEDWATAAVGLAVLIALSEDKITSTQWIYGVLAAALMFVLHLELGVRGRIGGGDVKLSPVPAIVLGAIHPLLALWSVALSFALQSGVQFSVTAGNRKTPVALPFVPSMLAASGVAALVGMTIFGG